MAMVQISHDALFSQPAEGPQREDGVEVVALVWGVVGVGPREDLSISRDLPVRAVAKGVVYVEAGLLGQVDPAGRDEREPAFVKGPLGADEGERGASRATGRECRPGPVLVSRSLRDGLPPPRGPWPGSRRPPRRTGPRPPPR